MKKILTFLILLIAVPCFAQWGTGWANFSGTTTNPLIAAYYTSLYANTLLPLTPNTGQLGTSGNAWNSVSTDSVRTSLLLSQSGNAITVAVEDTLKVSQLSSVSSVLGSMSLSGNTLLGANAINGTDAITIQPFTNQKLKLKGGNTTGLLEFYAPALTPRAKMFSEGMIVFGSNDSTKDYVVLIDSILNTGRIRIKSSTGHSSMTAYGFSADSGLFKAVAVAKDTCLEVALFTRTCTRDTLAFMTGADSLTAIYIVSPFATRGAMTRPPYVAGVVGGKLVIDRAAADTAFFDRYSVLKIVQR